MTKRTSTFYLKTLSTTINVYSRRFSSILRTEEARNGNEVSGGFTSHTTYARDTVNPMSIERTASSCVRTKKKVGPQTTRLAENTQSVEVTVSFAKLGIRPTPGLRIGLALAVTDATGDEAQTWFFAPPRRRRLAPPKAGEKRFWTERFKL
jgi:hypothetical protein